MDDAGTVITIAELDPSEKEELEKHLSEENIEYEVNPGMAGFLPLIPIIIVIAAAALVKVVIYIWQKFQYEQIITYHDGKIDHQIVKIRNGKILIFADKDTVVQIENPSDIIDLTAVAKAALGDASAGKDEATKQGANATVETPTDDETKGKLAQLAGALVTS